MNYKLFGITLGASLLGRVTDILTTSYGLSNGYVEINPYSSPIGSTISIIIGCLILLIVPNRYANYGIMLGFLLIFVSWLGPAWNLMVL